MKFTLNQYILNPQIKSGAVLNATAREAIRKSYMDKYNAIMVRERNRIDYTLYKDSKNNRYFAHFKIPSEVIEKFYYDTILEFYADENIKNTSDLFEYNVKFYSNDPAFVYTYAYTFAHNDLFADGLETKMSRKAIKKEATERNPYNQVGYVKSIYFAYLAMKGRGLNNTERFNSESIKYSKVALLSNVEQADIKVGAREEAQNKLNKKKKVEREKQQKESNNVSVVKPILGVKKTKTISSSKNTMKTVKKTKVK